MVKTTSAVAPYINSGSLPGPDDVPATVAGQVPKGLPAPKSQEVDRRSARRGGPSVKRSQGEAPKYTPAEIARFREGLSAILAGKTSGQLPLDENVMAAARELEAHLEGGAELTEAEVTGFLKLAGFSHNERPITGDGRGPLGSWAPYPAEAASAYAASGFGAARPYLGPVKFAWPDPVTVGYLPLRYRSELPRISGPFNRQIVHVK